MDLSGKKSEEPLTIRENILNKEICFQSYDKIFICNMIKDLLEDRIGNIITSVRAVNR
jgi:hypothetical protein